MVRSSPFRSICLLLLPFLLPTLAPAAKAQGASSASHRTHRRHRQRADAEPQARDRYAGCGACGSMARSRRPTSPRGSRNASDQILEGDFRLLMPHGSVVTGYALDIGGRMVDGVLVDQRQARIAYEARVRQRIDPGLAEVDRANCSAPGSSRLPPIQPHHPRAVHQPARSPYRLRPADPRHRPGRHFSSTLRSAASRAGRRSSFRAAPATLDQQRGQPPSRLTRRKRAARRATSSLRLRAGRQGAGQPPRQRRAFFPDRRPGGARARRGGRGEHGRRAVGPVAVPGGRRSRRGNGAPPQISAAGAPAGDRAAAVRQRRRGARAGPGYG